MSKTLKIEVQIQLTYVQQDKIESEKFQEKNSGLSS